MTEWYPYGPGGQPPYGPPSGYLAPPGVPGYLTDPLISPDYGGWWSRGLSIVKRGWMPLVVLQAIGVGVSMLAHAPILVYLAVMSQDVSAAFETPDPDTSPDLAPLFGAIGVTLLGVLLGFVIRAMVAVAAVHVGVSVAVGAPVRVADALRLAARRAFPLLGWQLLAAPIYVAAFCLCVAPVLYVAAVFVVLPVVVAVERTNAISRCFSLFHRDLGASVGRLATIMGLSIAGGMVGGLAAGLTGSLGDSLVNAALPDTAGMVGGSVISTFIGTLVSGAMAVLLTPLTLAAYADLRARVEPLRTMMLAESLGIVPPAPGPWPAGPTARPIVLPPG
ncbi:MAG TPA: hypothetical protein VFM55_07225 [Micromonosporaceae bacterium]|nr:hypothetical protein [Micromonosporaceae bacterium]